MSAVRFRPGAPYLKCGSVKKTRSQFCSVRVDAASETGLKPVTRSISYFQKRKTNADAGVVYLYVGWCVCMAPGARGGNRIPYAPLKPCGFAGGCPERVEHGTGNMCPAHKKETAAGYNKYRGSATKQGYGGAWLKVREKALKRDQYLCQHCLKNEGRMVPAVAVDHIVPFTTTADSLRLDLNNLQSLCNSCHARKGVKFDGLFGRPKQKISD